MKIERELFIDVAKKLGINTELVETPMGLMFKYGSTRDSFDIWQASAQREGYKLVPTEATEIMTNDGCDSISYGRTNEENVKRIYKAMIGASE